MSFDLPPPRFDHAFTGQLIEHRLSWDRLAIVCGHDRIACAFPFAPDLCVIILPNIGPGGLSPASYAIYRRHELGHCNGWSAKHEKE
jgi:hypothetical protein